MDLGLLDNEPARPFHEIRLERSQDFRSSLPYYDNTEEKQQELRQTLLVEEDIIWEVHLAREDFPEPLTPVNTVKVPFGISKLRFFRLCSQAPVTRIMSFNILL